MGGRVAGGGGGRCRTSWVKRGKEWGLMAGAFRRWGARASTGAPSNRWAMRRAMVAEGVCGCLRRTDGGEEGGTGRLEASGR